MTLERIVLVKPADVDVGDMFDASGACAFGWHRYNGLTWHPRDIGNLGGPWDQGRPVECFEVIWDETGAPSLSGNTALKNAAECDESWWVQKSSDRGSIPTAGDKQEWEAF